MPYLYELHSHTKIGSACSSFEPEEYPQYYIELGYNGMVISDHFYHGNTAIDRSLEWGEFVRQYSDGYRRAKEAGDKLGFSVFFGIEFRFKERNDEYIVLGFTPEWIADHPELRDIGRGEFFDFVHANGGYVIQAHPFRKASYISSITLSGDAVDAVEVFNSCNDPVNCRQAYEYAKNLGLPMVGGSDIHHKSFSKEHSGIITEEKLDSVEALIEALKSGRYEIAPKGKLEEIAALPLEDPVLPVCRFNGKELEETTDYYYSK